MTRYEKIAAKAVAAFLAAQKEPVQLFAISAVADRACREAGKKRDLFESLFCYERIKPADWRGRYLGVRADTACYYLVPPGWQEGRSESRDLALGSGILREQRVLD